MEGEVEGEAGQREERQIGAGGGLYRIRREGGVAAKAGLTALESSKGGHGDQSPYGDRHTEPTGPRKVVLEEGHRGETGHEEGKRVEEDGRSAVGDCLGYAKGRDVLSKDDGCGKELDETVCGEGEESGAVRGEGGAGGQAELEEHPQDRDGLEPENRSLLRTSPRRDSRLRLRRGGSSELT
jgi:hypothetical protein